MPNPIFSIVELTHMTESAKSDVGMLDLLSQTKEYYLLKRTTLPERTPEDILAMIRARSIRK